MKYLLLSLLVLLSSCQLTRPRYLRDEDLMRWNAARVKKQIAREERRARPFLRANRRARPF